MLADPAYGGNKDMVGWKWVGFPGDPMRRGDPYEQYIFTNKPYPYAAKPLPLMPKAASAGTMNGAAANGQDARERHDQRLNDGHENGGQLR